MRTFSSINFVSFSTPKEAQIPAKPPVIIAYPGLKIISHEAAIITPPAKVAFIIVSISSLPVLDLLINAAVRADAVIEKNVFKAARY